jgi:hypothetical protein
MVMLPICCNAWPPFSIYREINILRIQQQSYADLNVNKNTILRTDWKITLRIRSPRSADRHAIPSYRLECQACASNAPWCYFRIRFNLHAMRNFIFQVA